MMISAVRGIRRRRAGSFGGRTLVALLAFALVCATASAQSFPSRAVRIVTPFPPGGGTEVAARSIAEYLSPVLGQPVVVENRPGGNSVIASEFVAKAAPDGHTLLLTTDIHAINAAFGVSLPYDSLKDFSFIAQLTTSPLMLVAHPSLGVRTLPELAALARSRPGKLSFGSLGSSSPHYLGFEWWKRMANVDIIDVPYKGGGQVLADILGGQVDLTYIVAGNGIRQSRAGKLVALSVTSDRRASVAPEIPTIAESGYAGYSIVNWYAMVSAAGTPRPVITRLNAEIGAALRQAHIVERLAGSGLDVTTGSPEDMEALLRRDIDKYRRIIALTGAKPDGR